MAITVLPLDASSGAPSYTAQQTRQAFSALMGTAPSGRPLGAVSGVRPGTPSTTVFLSGSGSTTWNVAAHAGVVDAETAAAGPYLYATDGTDTGTITAANATNPRVDIVYVQVNDTVQDGSGLRGGVVGYLAGTAAASPVAPAAPSRSIVIANLSVPKSGAGSPTVTWVAPTFGQSAWSTYTPTWGSVGTAPSIGNGTITGKYYTDGKMVTAKIVVTVGSTTNLGSGAYTFSLPMAVNEVAFTSVGGGGVVYDASASVQYAAEPYINTSTTVILTQNNARVTNVAPITLAAGDVISVTVVAESL